MDKILSYKKFNESFGAQAFSEPMYGSDIFKIKHRALKDMSNKKMDKVNAKPINDLLDRFGVGDIVRGKAISDGSFYEGKIVNIGKDGEGENISISIECEGSVMELASATVTFSEDGGDVGNRVRTNIDSDTTDVSKYAEFEPTSYE